MSTASPGLGAGMTTSVVATSYGGPESLSVIEETAPEPGPGQVRVRTRAIGVNPFDVKVYSGAFGRDEAALPIRPGVEAAGVVDAVGSDDTGYAVGDEVIAFAGSGAYTTDLVVDARALVRKPAPLTWEQAAGLLGAGIAAVTALDASRAATGDVVLVHGAAGGVGHLVLQIARTRGVAVVGTAGERNHARLAAQGATPISYGEGLLERAREAAPGGYTAALDLVGTDEAIDTSLALVAADRVVSIAAFGRGGDGIVLIDGGPASARTELARLAEEGSLTVEIDRSYPLTEAAAAHDHVRTGHARGKVVLVP